MRIVILGVPESVLTNHLLWRFISGIQRTCVAWGLARYRVYNYSRLSRDKTREPHPTRVFFPFDCSGGEASTDGFPVWVSFVAGAARLGNRARINIPTTSRSVSMLQLSVVGFMLF